MIKVISVLGIVCLLSSCGIECKPAFEEGAIVRDKASGYKAVVTYTYLTKNDKGFCYIDVVGDTWYSNYQNPARFTIDKNVL